jgi:hypothetical protein
MAPAWANNSSYIRGTDTGSSMWDILQPDNIQGPYFTDHLNATRQLVETIRQLYRTVTLLEGSIGGASHRIALEECHQQYMFVAFCPIS